MTIQYQKTDDSLVLRLSGELDHHSVRGMLSSVAGLLDSRHPLAVTLDFGGVGFMDSSGIAVILHCHNRLREIGGELEVVGVCPQAHRVLRAAGVDRIVKISAAEAVTA